jgi:hypothetical protein
MSGIGEARQRLADSLKRRVPTFAVARDILALEVVDPKTPLGRELTKLAGAPSWYDEMPDDFDRVDPADTQLETFIALFPEVDVLTLAAHASKTTKVDVAGNPEILLVLAGAAREELGAGAYATAGEALQDFRNIELKNGLSRKALRKRLRFLRDFEDKTARVKDVLRLRHAQMQAKSRLAYEIDADQCDDLTLAFCAYLAARANRRSIFLVGEQSRAFDTIVAGLEQLLEENPDTNWSQVALVKPTRQVIGKLDPAARGALMGRFHAAMADSAAALGTLFDSLPERMRAEMVMVQGVDSSRWNAYAGSLNTMRSAWVSATLAAELDEVLDRYCPGKAPRLMASDLVWWYRSEGKDLHEDTRMFSVVPYPWLVISGAAELTREDILAAASKLKVEAEQTGWVGPRARRELEQPEAEPALVHGVVVSDPQLAARLRRCGVFSSKGLKHLDELPLLVAREVQVDDKGQLRPVVTGVAEKPSLGALFGVNEPVTGKLGSEVDVELD